MNQPLVTKPRKRRILHDFVLNAIAAVDSPCQEHALAHIIKRAPEPEIEKPAFRMTPEGQAVVLKACEAMQIAIDKNYTALAALNGTKLDKLERKTKMHPDPFMDHVARVQKRDACTRVQAMQRAATEEPESLAAFRAQGVPADNRAERIAKGRARQDDIRKRTREIMARDRVDGVKALQRLRDESPEIFEE